ncbi:OLC1v1024834C1 [Oldenlandia corymbosa var. corymbosa]|uniref:OLC1v1024834C1 n=1 Tax=Oldenlandia corymbosa var. corymbosa TaxID=529605 RepID=A0AAV1C3H7_OLDCO|nr:OLC1v1024834C1 [Oldenlandia corymbosa var. corymbosa]
MQHLEEQLSVTWRGRTFILEMDPSAKLKDLGDRLQELTNVKSDTMRLIVPAKKGSKLLYPFSDEHSNLSLEAASTIEGKSIRMMGVPENELDEVLQSAKTDLRIAGFDEEEKRLRQRAKYDQNSFTRLPQGNYIFSEFRTLSLPGIELNPPPSEALKLMHRLAADPGIVAIMNKHRWRVGIMTEMAPVGYVGVSPKCILGFNKNHGEEISLRLRTDDLKGFRKYESIKMTLCHELAHMVYSEHDANFYALDKQLNKEAAVLDWTKSKGHTLSEVRHTPAFHDEYEDDKPVTLSRKLGGQESGFSTVRASSVAAAYRRFAETSESVGSSPRVMEGPDGRCAPSGLKSEEVDVTGVGHSLKSIQVNKELENEVENPLDHSHSEILRTMENELQSSDTLIVPSKDTGTMEIDGNLNQPNVISVEPEPVDSLAGNEYTVDMPYSEPDPDDSQGGAVEPKPDDNAMMVDGGVAMDLSDEPDPDDLELHRIQDPVSALYSRLQKAIDMLRSEVDLLHVATVQQNLLKIIRNVIEHPGDMKFKKIRKANATVQRNILRYEGMDNSTCAVVCMLR